MSNPLFGLHTPPELALVLDASLPELRRIAHSAHNYISFETRTGGKLRQVTAPRPRLDAVQRVIHDHLTRLGQPDYLHSGVSGRSHVTHAAFHRGGAWLCKVDLCSFYLQVTTARVRRFFVHHMRCSADVAALLTQLCTVEGHLPVGGRVSQSLAFLASKPMFDALDHLALASGVRFSAYVDDLCFSGEHATPSFLWQVKRVIHAHGFDYHHARCYRPEQPRLVTGVFLIGGQVCVRARDAQQIRKEMLALAGPGQSEKALMALQGRLAASNGVESPRFLPALRAIQARLAALRRTRGTNTQAEQTQAPGDHGA